MINTGLGTFEPSEQEIGSLYNQTRTGFWESAGATFYNAWNYNPTSSVFRAVDQSQAYQSSNTYINRDELNKQYGYLGLTFKEDTREGAEESSEHGVQLPGQELQGQVTGSWHDHP